MALFRLTVKDEDALKQFLRPIANSRNDTFLTISYGAVSDFLGLPLDASDEDIIQVKDFFEGKLQYQYLNNTLNDIIFNLIFRSDLCCRDGHSLYQ